MKKLISLLIISLLAINQLRCEYFYIKNYKVDIQINVDGSFDVTEKIDVFFTEKRRGIIRKIPFRYSFDDLAKSNKNLKFGLYEIYFEKMDVVKDTFTTMEQNGYQLIRIGTEKNFISGDKQYIIKYKVWGAMNNYQTHSEFYWNVVGNQWDVTIQNASFNIRFARPFAIADKDILVYTGPYNSKESNATFTYTQTGVSGKVNDSLPAGHGATVAIRFPLGYFQKPYSIIDRNIGLQLIGDNSFIVKDSISVNFNSFQTCFLYRIPSKIKYYNPFDPINPVLRDSLQRLYISGIETGKARNEMFYSDTIINIRLYPEEGRSFKGEKSFVFKYIINGNIIEHQPGQFVNFSIPQLEWDVPQKVSSNISFLEPLELSGKDIVFYMPHNQTNRIIRPEFSLNKTQVTASVKMLPSKNQTILAIKLPDKYFDYVLQPELISGKSYIIKDFKTRIEVTSRGEVWTKYMINVKFLYYRSEFICNLNNYFSNTYGILPFSKKYFPDWSIFDNTYQSLVYDVKSGNGFESYGNSIRWPISVYNQTVDTSFWYEYKIYDILKPKGDYYVFTRSLLDADIQPLMKGELEVIFPPETKIHNAQVAILNLDTSEIKNIRTVKSENKYIIKFSEGPYKIWNPFVVVEFPKEIISISPFGLKWKLFYNNNSALFYPLFLLVILFIIWYFFGRDKKETIVVQFNPPEDITPAEAGLLWDGKLHKRDLVSFVYYWAGRGFLSIRDISSSSERDYELTKLKELPENAKSFEKTMFSGIFGTKEKVAISSLRDSFYSTMKVAHFELEKYSRTHKLYVPGTRGFGLVLIILGFICCLIGSINYIADQDAYYRDVAYNMFAFGVIFIFFGYFMPKKGHFGNTKYHEILGFKEFIVRAEIDRLKVLVQDNPKYFDETIAYAIILGLGRIWAEKLEPLIIEPPSYYSSYGEGAREFSTTLFTRDIISGMHKMERDFISEPKPVYSSSSSSDDSSSSSSYDYSSSSSSYSSSSSSSFDSSSGSSGGYSGGGYGGGGGSSW